jgi:kynurenine formamidase
MIKIAALYTIMSLFFNTSFAKMIDLTHEFDSKTIYWPTEKGFSRDTVFEGQTKKGYFYSAFKFCAPEHGGTHIDAPFHFSKKGITVDEIKLDNLIGNAVVIDVHNQVQSQKDYQISVDDIKAFEKQYRPIDGKDIVLFRTDWSQYWPNKKAYLGSDKLGDTEHLHFPGVSPDAAKYLVDAKVKGIGIDTASMDPGNSKGFLVHRIILGANLFGLENLSHLDHVSPIGSLIIIAPMKIKGGSGAPARVFVIEKK